MRQPIQTSRRDFLAMTLSLMGAGALTLTGCGSGGKTIGVPGSGGTTGAGFVSRRASVQLPTGFTLSPATLTIETGKSAVPLDATGAFTALTPNSDVPSLAMLRDQNSRGVLMGFLSTDGTPLTARSAAVALLYYALGGFMLPDASRRPLVTLLEADATTVTLAATISQRMVANPYVLEGDDAAINAALKTAFDTLNTTSRAVRATSFKAALAQTRATVDPILQVQPSGLLSNLEVLQGTGTTVTVVNHSRRFCRVYVYQTGTPDPLPKAILQNAPISLPSTNSLGVFSTINNLRSGQTAYVPVSTDPISLPLAAGSTKTLYETIVVGATSNDLPRGFYSDPKYVDEQAKWVQDQQDLSTQTWWQNLILPIIFEALGIAGLAATTSAVESSLAAIKAIGDASVVQILANAGKGSFAAATGDLLALAAESSAVGNQLRLALLPLYEAAIGQVAAETAAARLTLFARLIVRAAVSAVVLLGTGDIAAVIADTTLAQPAEQWFETVFQPTLILDPTTASVSPGGRVTFSVKPPTGTVGTISYAWTQTGATSTLSSSDGVVGNSITTTSTSVDLVTTPSDTGTITVTVVATLTDSTGKKSELGTAQASVTLTVNTARSYISATTQVVPSTYVSGADAGKAVYYGAIIAKIPASGWVQAMMEEHFPNDNYLGIGGTMNYIDYAAGAPVVGPGVDPAQWIPYGYARNGTGGFYNFGGGTVGYLLVSSGAVYPGGEQVAQDAVQKALDNLTSPTLVLNPY